MAGWDQFLEAAKGWGGLDPEVYGSSQRPGFESMQQMFRDIDARRFLSPWTRARLLAGAEGAPAAYAVTQGLKGQAPADIGPLTGGGIADFAQNIWGKMANKGWGTTVGDLLEKIKAGYGAAPGTSEADFSGAWETELNMLMKALQLGRYGPFADYARNKIAEEFASASRDVRGPEQGGPSWIDKILGGLPGFFPRAPGTPGTPTPTYRR